MKRFFKTAAFKAFAAVMVMLIAGSALSLAMRGGASPIVSAVGVVVSPLQSLCAGAANLFQDYFGHFRSSATLQAELAEMETELDLMRQRLVDYDKAMQKLELYEQFLGLKQENPHYEFKEASIIASDPTGRYGTFTLNRGSASGINVNDPVLEGKNLVGIVTATEPASCTVMTLLNPDVHVIIYETASGELGWTSATAELAQQGLICVPDLLRSTSIAGGGLICTSSEGKYYPAGLIVGTVQEVRMDDQGLSAVAVVKPEAKFESMRDVLVLTEF